MDLDHLRQEYSIQGKNGISFLLSAMLLWLVFGFLYFLPFDLNIKNIIMFMMTGVLFPLAVGISAWIRADWRQKDHPLTGLGLILNLAQFIYFPLVFWAFVESPAKMIIIFAVITGAHFFPYGWLYQAMGYYVIAPLISFVMTLIGWVVEPSQIWLVPMLMPFFLIILIFWLWIDYKKKITP